jgi:hypothetical protein
VKIQPQWVVTPGKQTNKHNRLQPTYYVLINFFHELNKMQQGDVSVGLDMQ